VDFVLKTESAASVEPQLEVLCRFLGAKKIILTTQDKANAPARVTPLGTIYLDLTSAVTAEDKAKLKKQLEEIQKAIASAKAKLENPAFTGKAPVSVIDGVRATMETNVKKMAELERLIG
jgi:valyl-tRNA synthetase